MSTIRISRSDSILSRYGDRLISAGRQAPQALSMAINDAGDKARTQVKRELVRQTGIKYGKINDGLATHRATQNRLAYELVETGTETNIRDFGPVYQTKLGVSATPWGERHLFLHAFIIARYADKVFIRYGTATNGTNQKLAEHGIHGNSRFPIRQVFGPNPAREITKDETAQAWEQVGPYMLSEVGRQLDRLLG